MIDVAAVLTRTRALVEPALRAEVDRLADPRMRRIAAYQMGWLTADGQPDDASGKAIRPAFTVLAAEVLGGAVESAVPAAAAVELVHNFSLLHDDVMDRDVVRRHRPTGWVAFGEGQAILAGSAMLASAIQVIARRSDLDARTLPCLLDAVQVLISGQSQDLDLEGRDGVTVDDVLAMEAGKTAALLECSAALGAITAGAPRESVERIAAFGHDVGIAFQLVDDILGITGDPSRTGKSSSADVRVGKRSAPIVAALTAGGPASEQLVNLMAGGPPSADEDVAMATKLIAEAGGLEWAATEADRRIEAAMNNLDAVAGARTEARDELAALARFVVDRDR